MTISLYGLVVCTGAVSLALVIGAVSLWFITEFDRITRDDSGSDW